LGSPTSLTQKFRKPSNQKFGGLKLSMTPKSRASKSKFPHHIKDVIHTIPHIHEHKESYEKSKLLGKHYDH
jgi:hypothetical protein